VNDAYLRQGILSVASAPIPPPGSVILPTRKQSEVEKIQQEDTTRMSTNFSKYQQTKQGQRIRSNVNSVLQALQDNHGVLQNISVSSSDYDEGAMDLFEDRLVSELKNIGVLDERFDSKTVVGFPSRREDDEISAELRVLQAQLLERTQPTNEIKRKIHSRVKKALKEERERERKDNEMKEIEKEWNRHLESMKAVQKK
jgi:transketolase